MVVVVVILMHVCLSVLPSKDLPSPEQTRLPSSEAHTQRSLNNKGAHRSDGMRSGQT